MNRKEDLIAVLDALGADVNLVGSQGKIVECLYSIWDHLSGSSEVGMTSTKLPGRLENISWNNPILSFDIERHGATVLGSSRGEVQTWQVDLEAMIANVVATKSRQLHKMDTRLDIHPIAEKIANAIIFQQHIELIEWLSGEKVRIRTSAAIPATNKETTAARRKRLISEVEIRVASAGWRRTNVTGLPVFERSSN